jgi:CTP-dependent riboflavin kinase
MKMTGIVQDGENNANVWLRRFALVYERWLAGPIYPGSLNLNIGRPFDWSAADLIPFRRTFSLRPHGGERDLYIVPCRIVFPGEQPAFLWTTTTAATEREDPEVVELISSACLRSALALKTGSKVEIDYPLHWGQSDDGLDRRNTAGASR